MFRVQKGSQIPSTSFANSFQFILIITAIKSEFQPPLISAKCDKISGLRLDLYYAVLQVVVQSRFWAFFSFSCITIYCMVHICLCIVKYNMLQVFYEKASISGAVPSTFSGGCSKHFTSECYTCACLLQRRTEFQVFILIFQFKTALETARKPVFQVPPSQRDAASTWPFQSQCLPFQRVTRQHSLNHDYVIIQIFKFFEWKQQMNIHMFVCSQQ